MCVCASLHVCVFARVFGRVCLHVHVCVCVCVRVCCYGHMTVRTFGFKDTAL